ncbi:MAG TPA: DUF692 domain-containing protein [Methylovirgula sp.]|nr:DUF692 domain-containing protein [Methylovirgula sp.]
MQKTSLPDAIGVGFKPQHFAAIMAAPGALGFFEIHAENYMGAGGRPHAELAALRRDHALSIHGVGLSIGGSGPLDRDHLGRLKALCDRYQPESFSEHLAWATHDGIYYNDLLPLPSNPATLACVIEHVEEVQNALGRRILIENPAAYLSFDDSAISEPAFLAELARRSGCGLLLDINNVYVSTCNNGFEAKAYLDAFPVAEVGEIHLAGHSPSVGADGATLLIDSHGAAIADPVFALYETVLGKTGPLPSLIERDNDVPEWPVLLAEAQTAGAILDAARAARRAAAAA